jgi:charged multivesicular body protein 3
MMNMSQQLSTLRVASAMEKSSSVMKSMQSLMKVQEISQVMQEMSREMMKAGIIEEMLDEVLDDQLEVDDELEEEAQKEVDKVLWELTAGQLGSAPAAVSDTLPTVSEGATASVVDEDEDISEMQQRLQALRS